MKAALLRLIVSHPGDTLAHMENKGRTHPKIIGDRSTAYVLATLLEIFDHVLLPFGENSRYDLLVDTGSQFIRVQCKTGRLRKGSILFPAVSSYYHYPSASRSAVPDEHRKRDYRGDADIFGVYCADNGKVYFVPVEEVGKAGNLRVEQSLNNQVKRIRWAVHYEGHAGLAQLAEQGSCKAQAVGSNPTPGSSGTARISDVPDGETRLFEPSASYRCEVPVRASRAGDSIRMMCPCRG